MEEHKEELPRKVIGVKPLEIKSKNGSKMENQENLYVSLREELKRKFNELEAQFNSDIESLDKKISALTERQKKLNMLGSFFDDLKESWGYKYKKGEIDNKKNKLKTELAEVPLRKSGLFWSRKEVENIERTAPVKQKLQEIEYELVKLDETTQKQTEENKRELTILGRELQVEEPITKEKVGELVDLLQKQINALIELREKIKQDFISKRNTLPIVGISPDGITPMVKQVEIKEDAPEPSFEFMAYGGTRYDWRTYIGKGPNILENGASLQSASGLSKEISFGIREIKGKRFLIFRQMQNTEERGGYPYTVLFDPGQEIKEKAQYNDAVIIRNVLEDPVLKYYFLKEPEKVWELKKILIARLNQSYLRRTDEKDTAPTI